MKWRRTSRPVIAALCSFVAFACHARPRVVVLDASTGATCWTAEQAAPIPVSDDEGVLVLSRASYVSARDLQTGRVLWTASDLFERTLPPRAFGDGVLVRESSGLVSREWRTGAARWSAPHVVAPSSASAWRRAQAGELGSGAGQWIALDPETGAERVLFPLPVEAGKVANILDLGAYAGVVQFDGSIVRVHRETGAARAPLAGVIRPAPLVLAAEGVPRALVLVTRTGRLACHDNTGDLRWSCPVEEPTALATTSRGLVLVEARDRVTLRDTSSGEELWRCRVGGSNARPLVHGDLVIVATDGAGVQALRLADGEQEWTYAAATVRDLGVADGSLFVRQRDGHLARLHLGTGDVEWTAHPRLAGFDRVVVVGGERTVQLD